MKLMNIFQIVEVNRKLTWCIFNFTEVLSESQMKVKALLNNFMISYKTLKECMCQ